ncbi:DUF2802 domain-containing protein [methane-oxidizing endosymbiont of Gigantopelta aegis]|uniref:DUF2802 domain-containing protein n=1 Tax=methane-oxidizing endosymbiont of Gigantopelta aegis TaxID=2794938 RepID=UPI0018DE4D6E|nr:DUF2802 domain-containing protein [methane-oxidizing endosymbiont of Gigantopelta aegis]
MTTVFLIALSGINLILCFAVIRLVIICRRLGRDVSELENQVARNSKDIAGLCSAAVKVDANLQHNAHFLSEIQAKLTDLEQLEHDNYGVSPYQDVIARIHQGATPEQLVKDCGISQEEAKLLIRLHTDSEA